MLASETTAKISLVAICMWQSTTKRVKSITLTWTNTIQTINCSIICFLTGYPTRYMTLLGNTSFPLEGLFANDHLSIGSNVER